MPLYLNKLNSRDYMFKTQKRKIFKQKIVPKPLTAESKFYTTSKNLNEEIPCVFRISQQDILYRINGTDWKFKNKCPGARLVAISVCRTRRIVCASSIARMRSCTVSALNSASRAISANGSGRKPAMRSSETARTRALVGSVISVGTTVGKAAWV